MTSHSFTMNSCPELKEANPFITSYRNQTLNLFSFDFHLLQLFAACEATYLLLPNFSIQVPAELLFYLIQKHFL